MVNKQFGLKINNNFFPVAESLRLVGDFSQFTRVALMFELLQYYSSQEKYRCLCGSAIN